MCLCNLFLIEIFTVETQIRRRVLGLHCLAMSFLGREAQVRIRIKIVYW